MGDEYHGSRAVPIQDATELASVDHIRGRMALVPGLIERWNRIAGVTANPRSELAVDDALTHWTRISSHVHHNLNHAVDCLRALSVLIPAEGELAIPFVAHYPVARSGLEAASIALWILHPADSRQRAERYIRNLWREVNDEASFVGASERLAPEELVHLLDRQRKQHKAWKKKYVDQIRAIAARADVADPTQARFSVGFAEIVREATEATGLPGGHGEMVWRMISGLSHPSMLRTVRFMQHTEHADYGDGVLGVQVTNDTATLQYTVDAVVLQLKTAMELLARRKIQIGQSRSA
ncbi:hypothetical protein OED01_12345 [Microbacterium sp. M28]|uniref:hypothetical protein n=1 Tax=Microbacterium sp. M28 TaxID=2962064 RepID=UPI0021F450F3|nr:hypothetical protein [Microbacterium sp. M28]UYO96387.1 hypothetical protein OED01_12345 [Microbacterium sp. M28]